MGHLSTSSVVIFLKSEWKMSVVLWMLFSLWKTDPPQPAYTPAAMLFHRHRPRLPPPPAGQGDDQVAGMWPLTYHLFIFSVDGDWHRPHTEQKNFERHGEKVDQSSPFTSLPWERARRSSVQADHDLGSTRPLVTPPPHKCSPPLTCYPPPPKPTAAAKYLGLYDQSIFLVMSCLVFVMKRDCHCHSFTPRSSHKTPQVLLNAVTNSEDVGGRGIWINRTVLVDGRSLSCPKRYEIWNLFQTTGILLLFFFFRVMTNKLILIVIIILEVAVLGGLVYWKFFT